MDTLAVIVPTRDRPDALRACLVSLQEQRLEAAGLDVAVVDDGSDYDVAGLVAEVSSAGPREIRCVHQAGLGLNSARNLGVRETRADLIAFLDDDTIASAGWAAAVIEAFATFDCDALGGRVELRLEGEAPAWLAGKRSYLSEFELGPRPAWLDGGLMPVGANCAVRRSALEAVGGFRAGLDRAPGSLVSNGDTEFFRRLRATGGRVLYVPSAHVLHVIGAERLTLSYFRARARAQGVSDQILAGRGRVRGMREVVRFGRVGPIAARGIASGRGLVNARLWAEYCRGRLAVLRSPHGAASLSESGSG